MLVQTETKIEYSSNHNNALKISTLPGLQDRIKVSLDESML